MFIFACVSVLLVQLPFWGRPFPSHFWPCFIKLQPVKFSVLSLYFDMSAQWLMGFLESWYNTITFSIFLSTLTTRH